MVDETPRADAGLLQMHSVSRQANGRDGLGCGLSPTLSTIHSSLEAKQEGRFWKLSVMMVPFVQMN